MGNESWRYLAPIRSPWLSADSIQTSTAVPYQIKTSLQVVYVFSPSHSPFFFLCLNNVCSSDLFFIKINNGTILLQILKRQRNVGTEKEGKYLNFKPKDYFGPRGGRSNLVADTLSKKKGCKIKTNCCLDKWLVIAHISNYVLSYHFSATLLLSCVPSGFTWNDPTSMALFGFTFLMSYSSASLLQRVIIARDAWWRCSSSLM